MILNQSEIWPVVKAALEEYMKTEKGLADDSGIKTASIAKLGLWEESRKWRLGGNFNSSFCWGSIERYTRGMHLGPVHAWYTERLGGNYTFADIAKTLPQEQQDLL